MSEVTNADRADFAAEAIEAFRHICSGSLWRESDGQVIPDGFAEAMGDLIGDLCHLAATHGLNPLEIVRTGISHYAVECVTNDGMFIEANVSLDVTAKIYGKRGSWSAWNADSVAAWRAAAEKEMAN